MDQIYVGIDVAKHQLDVWVWGAEEGDRLPHDQDALETLCRRLTVLDLDTSAALPDTAGT